MPHRLSPALADEDYFVPNLARPFARDRIARAQLRPGERILDVAGGTGDVAGGTGIVARLAAPLVAPRGRVTGLDMNPGMIKVARERTRIEVIAVEWREGDATALPFPDASFDVVCCQQGRQFMPEKLAAIREMRRVPALGGREFVTAWAPLAENYVAAVADKVVREHRGFSSIEGRYGLGGATVLAGLVREARFTAVGVVPRDLTLYFPDFGRHVRAVASPDLVELPPKDREEMLATIEAAMRPQLADFLDGAQLRCPARAYVATARK